MSILRNPHKKLSEQTVKEYALGQGGKYAAIYNQLVSVQKAGDEAKQMANDNQEALDFIKEMRTISQKNQAKDMKNNEIRQASNTRAASPRHAPASDLAEFQIQNIVVNSGEKR